MTGTNGRTPGAGVKIVRRVLADGTVKEYRYETPLRQPRRQEGDLRRLFNEYSDSPEFKALAKAWQDRKLWLFRQIEAELGWMTLRQLQDRRARTEFYALRDKHADLPHRADKMMQALSSALSWAYDRGKIEVNHAQRIHPLVDWRRSPQREKSYTEAMEEMIVAAAPADLLTAYLFGLYTGLRRGDLIRLAPATLKKDGWLELKPSKTLKKTGTEVRLPTFALAPLAELVSRLPRTGPTLLVTDNGLPWSEANLSHRWRRLMIRLGLDGMTFNIVRHTTNNSLLEAGCTEAERGAIMGHAIASGAGQAYSARTKELALNAYRKWNRFIAEGPQVIEAAGVFQRNRPGEAK